MKLITIMFVLLFSFDSYASQLEANIKLVGPRLGVIEFSADEIFNQDLRFFKWHHNDGFGIWHLGQSMPLKYKGEKVEEIVIDAVSSKRLTRNCSVEYYITGEDFGGQDFVDDHLSVYLKTTVKGNPYNKNAHLECAELGQKHFSQKNFTPFVDVII